MVTCPTDPIHPIARQSVPAAVHRIKPVSVHVSEVREMAGLSLAADAGCEIGGSLYGAHTPGGATVIHLAVPHGANATCQPAYFEDDPGHVRRLDAEIDQRFGIRFMGTFHLHPGAMSETSQTDERQVQRSSRKNGRRTGLQIITNVIHPPTPPWGWCSRGRRDSTVRLTLHFYYDALAGRHTHVPIRLLPGVSPVRLALMNDPAWADAWLGWHWASIGVDRIEFDQVTRDEARVWHPDRSFIRSVSPHTTSGIYVCLEDF